MSPPPATCGVAGAGVPLTGVPSLRLCALMTPVTLLVSLERPNALRSRESNCVSAVLTRTCASPLDESTPSVQVGDGSVPYGGVVVLPLDVDGGGACCAR